MDMRLTWLGVGAFATSTVAFVFAGLLPLIAASTGITVAGAGYLITAYSLSYAIGTPILSALAGGMDRRRLIGVRFSPSSPATGWPRRAPPTAC